MMVNILEQVIEGNPDVLQVVDTDYDDEHILLATIDPSFNPQLQVGTAVKTKSGHEFILNYNNKFPTLVIPQDAKALYANCSDIIPKVDNIKYYKRWKNYQIQLLLLELVIRQKETGTATKDSNGRLITADCN